MHELVLNIFHAAAYKHVPMMEDNVGVIQTNVLGVKIVADLAVKYNARKFVMISTDMVNPSNVMGCSKRICEIYVQSRQAFGENGFECHSVYYHPIWECVGFEWLCDSSFP